MKQVNFEREPTRYCPNLKPHAHFHDVNSGQIFDIDLNTHALEGLKEALPDGFDARSINITYRGTASR